MTKIINLTPHSINLFVEGKEIIIRPSGELARVTEEVTLVRKIEVVDGIKVPIIRKTFGNLEGLPEPQEGTIFIVSRLVKNTCPERDDVFSIGESVRNDEGRICGCKSFAS